MVVIYQATPSLFATPDVHENALLRAVAEYTLACFVPVIVSKPLRAASTMRAPECAPR